MPLISAGVLLAWWNEVLPRPAWLAAVAFQGVLLMTGFAAIQTGEHDADDDDDD